MGIFTECEPVITGIDHIDLFDSALSSGGREFVEYHGTLCRYELVFYLSGDYITCYNGKKMQTRENSILYLPKGVEGARYTVRHLTHGQCVDISFGCEGGLPKEAVLVTEKDDRIRRLFCQCLRLWQTKPAGYYARCLSVFYLIISLMQAADSRKYLPSAEEEKMAGAMAYIASDALKSDFDYRELARLSGMSYSHFGDLFLRMNGKTPSRFVADLRVRRACELLITGRYSIGEIASLTGFENVYYFSAFFKKETGYSPRNYLKNVLQSDANTGNAT